MTDRAAGSGAGYRQVVLLCVLVLLLCAGSSAGAADSGRGWLEVVRGTAYAESRGVAGNLATVRRWVLFSDSFCSEPERHLLLDHRWHFIGYIDNGADAAGTIERLNETRRRLAGEGRAESWHAGAMESSGYPFALACHQPFVEMQESIARLTGARPEFLVWGTWDGISVGTAEEQVSLLELFRTVVAYRREQGRFTFPDSVIPTFLGKVIIESGVRKNALSGDGARGIMQLSTAVLKDCRIPERFYLHRIVQVDCALSLVEQNHRNLSAPFAEVFGRLPEAKRDTLYGLMLTQAYLIGVGRSIELLLDPELGRAARYFAEHHEAFSAEDILIGMIYHNLGRRDLGLRSLYYVTDARLAQAALCRQQALEQDPWCPSLP